MLLQIKNLHNDTFSIEIHENESVKDLKEKIAEKDDLREKYTAELLKLLYRGKVMDDDDTIASFSIEDDKFLVLVKQTPGKSPPKKKKPKQGFNNNFGGFNSFNSMPQMSGSLLQHPFQQTPFMSQPFQDNTITQQPHFPAAEPSSGLQGVSSEAFSTAEDREEALNTLLSMGFEKKEAENALRAGFYNVQTAVELMTSGTVPTDETSVGLPQANETQLSPSSPTAHHPNAGGGMGATMKQMSEILKKNPEQLQVIKQQLQADHPEIASMIDNDPKEFIELLSQASADTSANDFAESHTDASGQNPNTIQVTLSSNDRQTITRLEDMGFERNRAIEAFLVCDRNEEQTINYLLNSFE